MYPASRARAAVCTSLAGCESALANAGERVTLFASLTADRQYRLVQEAHLVLAELANDRRVGAGGEGCSTALASAAARHAWLGAARVSRPDGSASCADTESLEVIDIADRSYFRAILAGESFAVSDQLSSRATSGPASGLEMGRPIVVAAVPIQERGRLAGVLSATIELQALADLLPEELRGDSGVLVDVIDSNGALLARHPHHADLIGRRTAHSGAPAVVGDSRMSDHTSYNEKAPASEPTGAKVPATRWKGIGSSA